MTLILALIAIAFSVYLAFDFLARERPCLYLGFQTEPGPKEFRRSDFRKLSQRQLRKNDRRLFAAGDRNAFA